MGVGFARQAWGFAHFDVAERVFRVAGVGNGGHRRRRARGFAAAVGNCARSRGRRGEWGDLLRRRASFCAAGAWNHVRQPQRFDVVAPCEKSAARVRVDVWGGAKSWQAQAIRWV